MKHLYKGIALIVLVTFAMDAMSQNSLSEKEKKQGWKLLFDGTSLSGWKRFNSDEAVTSWKVSDGTIHLDKSVTSGRGDLITTAEYENYELSIDWKIDACGNSGIIFNVIEDPKYSATYVTGPEMQVLDNTCHPDAKIIKHRAGDLYDLISCNKETVKPAGEWNHVRIISKDAKMEFWLNGTRVVSFTMHTQEWDKMVAGSKFNTMPDFGKSMKGHIALQDHGDEVWYRNIKVKEIK